MFLPNIFCMKSLRDWLIIEATHQSLQTRAFPSPHGAHPRCERALALWAIVSLGPGTPLLRAITAARLTPQWKQPSGPVYNIEHLGSSFRQLAGSCQLIESELKVAP